MNMAKLIFGSYFEIGSNSELPRIKDLNNYFTHSLVFTALDSV